MGFRDRLDEMRRESEARCRAALADATKAAAREFTGEDTARSVRVNVDGDGAVRGIRVSPRGLGGIAGDELSRRVVEAVRAARHASRGGTSKVRKGLSGDDANALQHLRDDAVSGASARSVTSERRPEPDSVDALMQEFRRFRAGMPLWADALGEQEASGAAARGSVRAVCAASGKVTRVEIDAYFPQAAQPEQVEAAILRALQRAQAEAARQVTAHQEKLEFMGLPIGEVVSGKRSLPDALGIPQDRAGPTDVKRRSDERRV